MAKVVLFIRLLFVNLVPVVLCIFLVSVRCLIWVGMD